MKKILLATIVICFFVSCSKEGGNKAVISQETTEASSKDGKTLRYVAEDGSSALVTFGNDNTGKFISIKSNKKTIRVKHKESTPTKDVYDENTVNVVSEGDSITITQGQNIILLKKARGQ